MSTGADRTLEFRRLIVRDWQYGSSNGAAIQQELERLRTIAKAEEAAIVRFGRDTIAIESSTNEAFRRRLEKVSQLRRAHPAMEPFELNLTGNLKGSIVGLPLGTLGRVARYILFFHRTDRFFTPRLSYQELFCLRFAVTEQVPQFADKQDDLVQGSIGALLSSELSANPFQTTLELLLKLFRCDQGTIWEYHDNSKFDDLSYLTLEGLGNQSLDKYTHTCLAEPQGVVWQALKKGAPGYILKTDTKIEELVNKSAQEEYTNKPLVLLRLEAGDTIYGVACLNGLHPSHFDEITPALAMFQNIAALEIHNKRLEQRNRVLQKISEIIPNVTTSIEDACQTTAEKVRELLDVQATSIFLKPDLNPSARELRLVASSVRSDLRKSEALRKFEQTRNPIEYRIAQGSFPAQIVIERKPRLTNAALNGDLPYGRFYELDDGHPQSWIGVPINYAGACVGVLSCSGKQTTLAGKQLHYVFNSFDVFVLEDAARILSPILEAIGSFTSLESVNRRLALSERIREHEMTAPLAAISGNAAFVLRHLEDSGVRSKGKRLTEIVSDAEMCAFLLREPRVPKQPLFDGGLRYLSIKDLLAELVSFLQRQIEARSPLGIIKEHGAPEGEFTIAPFMKIELQGSAPKTMLSKYLIQRALYNMGVNAVKYGVPNGRLIIALSEEKEDIHIDFKDNGIGIEPEDASSVFDEGFRGSNTQGRSGEGLGLRITKEVIESHGGRIALISARTPTWFRVRLPVRRPSNQQQSPGHPSILRMDTPKRRRTGETHEL